jgi:hypothetical protein
MVVPVGVSVSMLIGLLRFSGDLDGGGGSETVCNYDLLSFYEKLFELTSLIPI